MHINKQTNVNQLVAIQIAKEEKEEASLTLKSIKKIYLFLDKLGYSRSMTKKTLGRKTTKWRKLADSEVLDEEVPSEWNKKRHEKHTYLMIVLFLSSSLLPILSLC